MAFSPSDCDQLILSGSDFTSARGVQPQACQRKAVDAPLLSDTGNRVARKFSLVYELPDDLREVYLSFGGDLEKFNGDESWTLPMPVRFVIDRSGIIRSSDVNADYTIRPEPEDTVNILRCLTETSTSTQDMDLEAYVSAAPGRFGKADARYQLEGMLAEGDSDQQLHNKTVPAAQPPGPVLPPRRSSGE
jgi:hypothetical protein